MDVVNLIVIFLVQLSLVIATVGFLILTLVSLISLVVGSRAKLVNWSTLVLTILPIPIGFAVALIGAIYIEIATCGFATSTCAELVNQTHVWLPLLSLVGTVPLTMHIYSRRHKLNWTLQGQPKVSWGIFSVLFFIAVALSVFGLKAFLNS